MRLIFIFWILIQSFSIHGQEVWNMIRKNHPKIELDTLEELQLDTLPVNQNREAKTTIDGKVYSAIVTAEGDTIIIANDLTYISITSMRSFSSDEEYRKYMKFRRYASQVYPYAKEAIRIYRELEYAEAHLSKKDKKNRIKELQEELKNEFEDPLSRLTKLQGKILLKMIERELDLTTHDLIKDVRGKFTAFYWNNFSKLYSYDLKEGYNIGKYPILDAVLKDFDLATKIESTKDLKYVRLN